MHGHTNTGRRLSWMDWSFRWRLFSVPAVGRLHISTRRCVSAPWLAEFRVTRTLISPPHTHATVVLLLLLSHETHTRTHTHTHTHTVFDILYEMLNRNRSSSFQNVFIAQQDSAICCPIPYTHMHTFYLSVFTLNIKVRLVMKAWLSEGILVTFRFQSNKWRS